jgi:hypothetical protein
MRCSKMCWIGYAIWTIDSWLAPKNSQVGSCREVEWGNHMAASIKF